MLNLDTNIFTALYKLRYVYRHLCSPAILGDPKIEQISLDTKDKYMFRYD